MLMTQLTHLVLLPPLLQCWLGLLSLWLVWRGRRRTGAAVALLAMASLYLLSTPGGSARLLQPLEGTPLSPATAAGAADAGWQAIVVLGGGRVPQAPEYGRHDTVSLHVLGRLRYAAQLQRSTGLPVLVTGGAHRAGQVPEAVLMAQVLQSAFGVPVRWLESSARTTRENALASASVLPPDVRRVLLVSDAWHLRRATIAFERAGFEVLPAGTGWTPPAAAWAPLARWLPQHESLAMSRRALHEWLGLLQQRMTSL